MADKPLQVVAGRVTEVEAKTTSAGAGDAGKIPALDGTGRLDPSMMPVGVAADVTVVPASEALSAGDYVNLWNDAGTMKARKADATSAGKEADGFVIAAVANGANASVYHEGGNTALSSLTLGARYYLATTPGAGTTTPPDGAGNVLQYLGRAVSTTKLVFEADEGIVQA
jgi:hypothetical protein